ncbi:CoA transferase, partial [Lysinibacillus fusiformis]|uniref:CoA transferase n=1 Tax=Lysinibacillus fusiformis TaxID=28031 RepID=UPI00201BBB17
GLLDYSETEDKKPVSMGVQLADIAGGTMHAAIGVLAAALHREKSGEGQFIDISMTDPVFSLNAMYGAAFIGGGRVPQPEQERYFGGSYY